MHEITINSRFANEETVGNAIAFDKGDKKIFKEIYQKWIDLNSQIALLKGRKIMFPIDLVESIIALKCNMWKVTNSMSRRYDLWDPNNKEGKNRILVQATTNAVFQMVLADSYMKEIDRVFFVKLFILDETTLHYEIYDFDIEMIYENIEKRPYTRRVIIKYDDIKNIRFLYKGIIIKHNKTEPTYTKTSLFLCEKRRFFMARTEKGVVATI